MHCQLFGQTGLRVSELFLGAMTFGEQGRVGAPIEECRRMVDAYADAGGNVIATASNYLVLSLETSPRRLRTDYMDVYWVHIWDARTPVEETMRAIDDAVRAGKVLYTASPTPLNRPPGFVEARGCPGFGGVGWLDFMPPSLVDRSLRTRRV